MPVHFFDTSALVKRYAMESGSDLVTAILEAVDTTVVIADLTRAEVISALSRRRRVGDLSAAEYDALKLTFGRHVVTEYLLVAVESQHVSTACRLVEQHGLRAYDAIQLSIALAVGGTIAPLGATLSFVSADDALIAAARSEGLAVLNPAAAAS